MKTRINHGLTKNVGLLTCVVALNTALAGCATTEPQTVRTKGEWELRVQARATERWDLMIVGNFAKAHTYLSPPSRSVTTVEALERTYKKFAAVAATAPRATCEGSVCNVQLSLSLEHRIPRIGKKIVSIPIAETWIISDGDAWFVQK